MSQINIHYSGAVSTEVQAYQKDGTADPAYLFHAISGSSTTNSITLTDGDVLRMYAFSSPGDYIKWHYDLN